MVLTVGIVKGGTGKTSTAAALAQAAAHDGRRVLCIDLDPQANLTYILGADGSKAGAYQLLTGEDPEIATQETEQGLSVIAASPDLATLKTAAGSAKRLKAALDPVRGGYDWIIVDTPPQMGELTYNAIVASDRLLVPLEADVNSMQGFYQILDVAAGLRKGNPLEVSGIIVTRYDGRPKINRHLLTEIQKGAEEAGAPFLGTIRAGVAIREAQALQVSLYEYAPKSKPALDYMAIYNRLKQ